MRIPNLIYFALDYFGVFALCFKFFLRKIGKLLQLIRPDLKLRIFWDMIQASLLMIQMWYIPLQFSFDFDLNQGEFYLSQWFFKYIPCVFFVFDILFNFVTGYYSKGIFVTHPSRIARHYFKKNFWFDSLTLIPLLISYFLSFNNRVLPLIFMIRALRLKNMISKIEDSHNLVAGKVAGGIALFKLAAMILYLAHLCACTWHFVADSNSSPTETWLFHYDLWSENWEIRYLNSIYYSIVTIVTVGYGDITPQNSSERILSIFIILLGCCQFAYSINMIGVIFHDMYKDDVLFHQKLSDVNKYMNQKGIKKDTQIRVRKYLEYIFDEEQNGVHRGQSVIQSLSMSLKEEILLEVYKKSLDMISFLKYSGFSPNFLNQIALSMKETSFAPEEIINKENSEEERRLYLITGGETEIYLHINKGEAVDRTLKVLKKGETMGEISFITGRRSEFSFKSIGVTHLIYINRTDFLEILQMFPEDYEKFCMLRDNILLYNNTQQIGLQCYACSRSNHDILNCPFISYQPDRDGIIKRFTFDPKHKRENHNRRKIDRVNTLLMKEAVEKASLKWQEIDSANQRRLLYGFSRTRKTLGEQAIANATRKASFNSVDYESYTLETESERERGSLSGAALANAVRKLNSESSPVHRSKVPSVFRRDSYSTARLNKVKTIEENQYEEDHHIDLSPAKNNSDDSEREEENLINYYEEKTFTNKEEFFFNRDDPWDTEFLRTEPSSALLKRSWKRNEFEGALQLNHPKAGVHTPLLKIPLNNENFDNRSHLEIPSNLLKHEIFNQPVPRFYGERIKIYTHYFPWNNIDQILKNMKLFAIGKRGRARRRRVLRNVFYVNPLSLIGSYLKIREKEYFSSPGVGKKGLSMKKKGVERLKSYIEKEGTVIYGQQRKGDLKQVQMKLIKMLTKAH